MASQVVRPKTYSDWSRLAKKLGYEMHQVKYGHGGKRLEQCVDKEGTQGLWNHTDNTGYLYEPINAEVTNE